MVNYQGQTEEYTFTKCKQEKGLSISPSCAVFIVIKRLEKWFNLQKVSIIVPVHQWKSNIS